MRRSSDRFKGPSQGCLRHVPVHMDCLSGVGVSSAAEPLPLYGEAQATVQRAKMVGRCAPVRSNPVGLRSKQLCTRVYRILSHAHAYICVLTEKRLQCVAVTFRIQTVLHTVLHSVH